MATATVPLRVLVVEDNEDVREMLGLLLESLGCEVTLRADGRTGLAAALASRFDLVLLDLGLPELDGFEIARALRACPGTRDVPLVAVSGYTQPEHVQRAREAGFDRHLAKPIGDHALQALLRIAARRRDRDAIASAESELAPLDQLLR